MQTTCGRTRVSHLTFSVALQRMLRGPFTLGDLREATGLSQSAIYDLVHALEAKNTIVLVKKTMPRGRNSGPLERVFELVRLY